MPNYIQSDIALLALKANSSSYALTASFALNGGGGGSSTPGGSDTEVQFNDAGTFSGSNYFTFDKNTLGTLPTHAGIVWTDSSYGGPSGTDGTPLNFEAFNSQGDSLGKIQLGQNQIGDGRFDGTTSDDRFFGVINPEGISKISISQTLINAAISVDHLQYGSIASQPPKSVPEPSNIFSLGLVGLGLAAIKVKGILSKKAKSPTDNSQTTDS
jgi:hypothetical protein